MTINIQLRPEDESALRERARMSGRDLAGYVGLVLKEHLRGSRPDIGPGEPAGGTGSTPEDLIDWEAVASCEEEADDAISLEEVRAATSTIKDSMARVVIEEERAERFWWLGISSIPPPWSSTTMLRPVPMRWTGSSASPGPS